MDTREFRGLWWLPAVEDDRLAGTLTVSEGRCLLEVMGDFGHSLLSETTSERTYSFDLAEQARIVGISTGGQAITLERATAVSHTMSFPGMSVATYRAEVALIGARFAHGDAVAFDEIAIRASDLNEWTQVSGFKPTVGLTQDAEDRFTVFSSLDVRYDAPDDIEIALARGEEAFIRFDAPSKGLSPGSTRLQIHQQAALHLRFARRRELADVFERVLQVRNFLSLAVGRPVAVLSVTGHQKTAGGPSAEDVATEVHWEIPYNPDSPPLLRMPQDMIFTLPEATPDASRVLRNWFAKQARLAPVFDLFFGARHNPNLPLEVRFLTYAQALETYDYRRRRAPSRVTLAERMRAVLTECRTVAKRVVGSAASDEEAFIEAFRVARNYYTHYDPRLEGRVARGAELHLRLVQLQTILEMALLRELGFGCRAIDAAIERTRRYQQIDHLRVVVAEGRE